LNCNPVSAIAAVAAAYRGAALMRAERADAIVVHLLRMEMTLSQLEGAEHHNSREPNHSLEIRPNNYGGLFFD
jgi:hypothetical protein